MIPSRLPFTHQESFNRNSRKNHRSGGGKHRREEILFIPDSCCRPDENKEQAHHRHRNHRQHSHHQGGEKRKKKKDATGGGGGGGGEKAVLSCESGVPVSYLKKIIADSSDLSLSSSFSSPVYVDGCYSGLKAWFFLHQAALSYSILGVAVLQFLGLLAAMMLFCVLGEYGRFW